MKLGTIGLPMALALLLNGTSPAGAVDFGKTTPTVNQLVDELAPSPSQADAPPPPKSRGLIVVSGAAASAKGKVSMQIGFEFGSSGVMARDLPKLQVLADALNTEALRSQSYKIVGHTDAVGSLDLNMRLSRQRADSVLEFLSRQGVAAGRLIADGRGPTELLNPQQPGAAENRRVEVRLVAQ